MARDIIKPRTQKNNKNLIELGKESLDKRERKTVDLLVKQLSEQCYGGVCKVEWKPKERAA